MKEASATFGHSKKAHLEAAFAPNALRASIDAKAPVLIGPFSRGGAASAPRGQTTTSGRGAS